MGPARIPHSEKSEGTESLGTSNLPKVAVEQESLFDLDQVYVPIYLLNT
jgi:hypothetical protein